MVTENGMLSSLSESDIRWFLDIFILFDWELPEEAAMQVLRDQFGWHRVNQFEIETPIGMTACLYGSRTRTYAADIRHTSWNAASPQRREVVFSQRYRALEAEVSEILGTSGTPGRKENGEIFYWDLSNGVRVQLDRSMIKVSSPDSARAERFAQEDPEKYASYGEEGEYA